MIKALLIQKCMQLKNKTSKQNVANFVTSHPRLIMVLAGLGIQVSLAFILRSDLFHEAFATAVPASPPASPDGPFNNLPVDHMSKTAILKPPVDETTAAPATCQACIDKLPEFFSESE